MVRVLREQSRFIIYVLAAALLTPVCLAAQDKTAVAPWKTDFSRYIVHPDSLVDIGPRDRVPSIDAPSFVSIGAAEEWLSDREPVAVVSIAGESRAYPVQILLHHDVVNDWLADRPLVMSFCILCGSAVAFDRRVDGQVLDFAFAGYLHNSNLVMYDRQTESFWGQAVGEGLVGRFAGVRLEMIPAPVMSFGEFRRTYSEGVVLSRETGYDKEYGAGRLIEYDQNPNPIKRVFAKETDKRLSAKERVMVIERAHDVVAVPYSALAERRVITTEVAGEEFVIFWGPGTASIYAERTADGRDVGAAVAYYPEVDARRLRFEPTSDNRFRDRETKSIWSLGGVATEGPLAGKSLRPADGAVHFWFVWAAYRPSTRVVTK